MALCLLTALAGSAAGAPPLVTFMSHSSWPGGYNGSIVIQNKDAAAIVNWVLTFSHGPDWSDMWNATGSKNGVDATILHAPWNGTIPAGGAVTIGFTGAGTLLQNVVNCQVNGIPAGVAYEGADPGSGPPVIVTASVPKAGVGVPYSHSLMAAGGTPPYTWSLESGPLPPDLSLAATGVISGAAVEAGTWSTLVKVTDATQQSATRQFELVAFELPTISISDAQVVLAEVMRGGGATPGFLSTSGNQIIDAGGNPVRIAGVNWFGFETHNHVVHGLWTRNYKSMLEQVVELGFNALRVPFCNEMLDPQATTSSINFAANPELVGLKPIQVLDAIIAHCGELGLRVILDRHSGKVDNYPNESVWYIPGDPNHTEERWIADWTTLALRYLGNPTVIGADLFNEPKNSATWGDSSPATDWNKAAERCGNAILAVNSDWLIIVEGVEQFDGQNTWWGGNLAGAAAFPVVLSDPQKLVYSMHDYPATVFQQSWFGAPDYPANLPALWHGFWGYLFEEGTAPLLLGEFGTKLQTNSDQLWLDTLTDYINGDFDLDGQSDLSGAERGMSWTYWCLNPNSSDTGGILADDWVSVNQAKMEVLSESLAPLIGDAAQPAQQMVFHVPLSAPAPTSIALPWSTLDGTALAGVNYLGAAGTLSIQEGASGGEIVVLIPPQEAFATTQFQVQLGMPTNALIGDGVATGTILVACPGDLDGSGSVDGADLGMVLSAWGQIGGPADLDGSGVVDGADLGAVLAGWGEC
jgi:chitinase